MEFFIKEQLQKSKKYYHDIDNGKENKRHIKKRNRKNNEIGIDANNNNYNNN